MSIYESPTSSWGPGGARAVGTRARGRPGAPRCAPTKWNLYQKARTHALSVTDRRNSSIPAAGPVHAPRARGRDPPRNEVPFGDGCASSPLTPTSQMSGILAPSRRRPAAGGAARRRPASKSFRRGNPWGYSQLSCSKYVDQKKRILSRLHLIAPNDIFEVLGVLPARVCWEMYRVQPRTDRIGDPKCHTARAHFLLFSAVIAGGHFWGPFRTGISRAEQGAPREFLFRLGGLGWKSFQKCRGQLRDPLGK